jgi:dihydroorotase-like cyclic amidohydrolase
MFADIVIWDPEERFKGAETHSKYAETCPYLGFNLYGVVKTVYIRGKIAYTNATFQPVGDFVSREV